MFVPEVEINILTLTCIAVFIQLDCFCQLPSPTPPTVILLTSLLQRHYSKFSLKVGQSGSHTHLHFLYLAACLQRLMSKCEVVNHFTQCGA